MLEKPCSIIIIILLSIKYKEIKGGITMKFIIKPVKKFRHLNCGTHCSSNCFADCGSLGSCFGIGL